MKLECSTEKIKNAVSQTEKIISRSATLPILNSVLLEASGKSLKIRSTNLSIGLEIEIPANIEKEGRVTILGDVLNNTILNIGEDKILKIYKKDNNIVITNKNNSITLKLLEDDDFPSLPVINDGESFKMPVKRFIEGVKSVYYSSAVSEIKPEISSVFIYTNDDGMYFVSTDSFRLAEKNIKNIKNIIIDGILIPFKNIIEILKILSNYNNEDIDIRYNKNQISFSFSGFYLTSRLIDGVFPDYRQIIPSEQATKAIVLKSEIQNALKLSNIFSDKFNQITISVKPKDKTFEVYAQNKDIGENKTNIQGSLVGEDIKMNLNLKYFLDSFQSIQEDSILLIFNGPNRPLIIKGNGDKTFQYLIMPMNR